MSRAVFDDDNQPTVKVPRIVKHPDERIPESASDDVIDPTIPLEAVKPPAATAPEHHANAAPARDDEPANTSGTWATPPAQPTIWWMQSQPVAPPPEPPKPDTPDPAVFEVSTRPLTEPPPELLKALGFADAFGAHPTAVPAPPPPPSASAPSDWESPAPQPPLPFIAEAPATSVTPPTNAPEPPVWMPSWHTPTPAPQPPPPVVAEPPTPPPPPIYEAPAPPRFTTPIEAPPPPPSVVTPPAQSMPPQWAQSFTQSTAESGEEDDDMAVHQWEYCRVQLDSGMYSQKQTVTRYPYFIRVTIDYYGGEVPPPQTFSEDTDQVDRPNRIWGQVLGALGLANWEMVNINLGTARDLSLVNIMAYFKRPVQEGRKVNEPRVSM